jgi:hypothetical protein
LLFDYYKTELFNESTKWNDLWQSSRYHDILIEVVSSASPLPDFEPSMSDFERSTFDEVRGGAFGGGISAKLGCRPITSGFAASASPCSFS